MSVYIPIMQHLSIIYTMSRTNTTGVALDWSPLNARKRNAVFEAV